MKFSELNLDPKVLESVYAMGFDKPTPIQEQAIPHILNNKDLIACAQTGTGKTAAYILPILNKLANRTNSISINTIVVVPTRELAIQIDQHVEGFSYFVPVTSIAIYGGGEGPDWDRQRKAIEQGVDIIIATPGRLLSHLGLGYVNASHLEHLVLDEADRMLDMGFYEDIMRIIKYIPAKRQTLLFSATMPKEIRKLANTILQNPEEISIAVSKPAEGILQGAYLVNDNLKVDLVQSLLKDKDLKSVIIFSATKSNVKVIEKTLKNIGFSVASIHSDLEQKEREEVMRRFRNRKIQILVATDIVSRGIDIEGIDLIINFDAPNDPEDYIHRVGRTARAESTGVALTFINDYEHDKFMRIEELLEYTIHKIPLPAHIGEARHNNRKRVYKAKSAK